MFASLVGLYISSSVGTIMLKPPASFVAMHNLGPSLKHAFIVHTNAIDQAPKHN